MNYKKIPIRTKPLLLIIFLTSYYKEKWHKQSKKNSWHWEKLKVIYISRKFGLKGDQLTDDWYDIKLWQGDMFGDKNETKTLLSQEFLTQQNNEVSVKWTTPTIVKTFKAIFYWTIRVIRNFKLNSSGWYPYTRLTKNWTTIDWTEYIWNNSYIEKTAIIDVKAGDEIGVSINASNIDWTVYNQKFEIYGEYKYVNTREQFLANN